MGVNDGLYAAFELGIKFGAVYHQFIGMPINPNNIDIAKELIKTSISSQPYVEDVEVNIDRDEVLRNLNTFGYTELSGRMMRVRIQVVYKNYRAVGVMEYNEELAYPLMRLVSVEEVTE